jgi:protease-4
MSPQEVDRIARGRIWSGTDALEIGLVDEIGGVVEAVDRAWALAEMPRTEQPVIRVYPEPGLFSGLGGPMSFLGIFRGASVSEFIPVDQNSPLFLMAPVDID